MAHRGTLVTVGATGAVAVIAWRGRKRGRPVSILAVGRWSAVVAGRLALGTFTGATGPVGPEGSVGPGGGAPDSGPGTGPVGPQGSQGGTEAPPASGGIWSNLTGDLSSALDDVGSTLDTVATDFSAGLIANVITVKNLAISAVQVVGHIASSALNDIESWVEDIIGWAVEGYDEYIQPLFRDIISMVSVVWQTIDPLINQVLHDAQKVALLVDNIGTTILDDVKKTAIDIWNEAVGVLQDGFNLAIAGINDVIDGVVASVNFLTNDVIDPIKKVVEGVAGTIASAVNDAWGELWNHVIGPAIDDIKGAVDGLIGLGGAVAGDILFVVDLVEKCLDWLLWMSEHSFEDIVHLWGMSPEDIAKSILKDARSGLTTSTRDFEEFFTDLLGA